MVTEPVIQIVDISGAIERRKQAAIKTYEERQRMDERRAAQRQQRLSEHLADIERFTTEEGSKLVAMLNHETAPVLLEDWLILDSWSVDEAILLLLGIQPLDHESLEARRSRVTEPIRNSDILLHRTVWGLPLWRDYSEYIPDWKDRIKTTASRLQAQRRRLQKIWSSGNHPERPSPAYVIEWAQKKGIPVPWLEAAADIGVVDRGVAVARSPMGERERTTLLILIGALAQEAKIDLAMPSKAAGQIELITEKLGARVAKRTIEEHLKRVRSALEKRATP